MKSPLGFARWVLVLSAATFAGAGLAFLLWPAPLTGLIGIELTSKAARNDVRAVFGGLELGIGAFLAACSLSASVLRVGLRAQVCAFGGMLAGRIVSLSLDGVPGPLTWVLGTAELVGVAAGLAALVWLRRTPSPPATPAKTGTAPEAAAQDAHPPVG